MRFYFAAICWGNLYSDLFLNVTIPHALKSGGIPSLDDEDIVFDITTSAEDEEKFKSHPSISRLKKYGDVHIYVTDVNDNPQTVLLNHSKISTAEALNQDAYFKFFSPDVLYTPGAFEYVYKILKTGKRALVIPTGAIRAKMAPFLNDFTQNGDVYYLLQKHMHQETRSHLITSDHFHPYPAMIIYPGMKIRSFICQPWFVRAVDKKCLEAKHPEYDFISLAVPDINDIHIVKSSDEIFEASLTLPYPEAHAFAPKLFSTKIVSDFMRGKATPHMIEFFKTGYNHPPKDEIMSKILDEMILTN